MSPLESKELTTLSGVALGGIVGGLLASPLGPWVAVTGSTVGATVGGWVTSTIWQEFYTDLREKMEKVKILLEQEKFAEAVDLISQIRAHPKYEEQERHFRSELEVSLGRITLYLAHKAEGERDYPRALDYYRRARQMRPADADILERIIRLKVETTDLTYEESGQLRVDLEDLLAIDPQNGGAYRGLRDLYDRQSKQKKALETLRKAAHEMRDRVKERTPFLEELHRRLPDDKEITLELIGLYLTQGADGEAAALIDEENSKGEPLAGEPNWEAAKGEAFLRKGDIEQAEPPLRKALEEKGVLPRANLALGKVLTLQKKWGEAANILAPLVSFPRYIREALVPLTEALIKSGKHREAELHLERATFKELPQYAATLKQLATAYENKGSQDKARRLWNLLGEVSGGPPFWQQYAIVYREANPVLLGSGRMGRVYLGRRREDEAMVAIREVPFVGMHDTLRLKRFRREVEILSELDHPNIARLHGHALLEGKCLLAIEYCRKGSLKDKLGEQLLWGDIKKIALGLLSGLKYLHEHKPTLVHRNLKPSNILLGEKDTPKIADFALSRLLESPSTSVITSVQEQAAGYRYLSPEVILGSADIGPAADYYALGCVLYEMTTGAPPFDFPSTDDQIRAHLKSSPEKPSKKAGWVPAELDKVILSLLEKTPGKRLSDNRAIVEVLGRI